MPFKSDGTQLFHKLADRGYTIIPIAPQSKVPSRWNGDKWLPLKNWPKITNDNATIDTWCTWPAPGVGFVTGGLIGLDLDITHKPMLIDITKQIDNIVGISPLQRQGRAPKLMLLYRTQDHIPKLYSTAYSLPPHPKNQIEILGHGQQFVAYGTHPDTKNPYTWLYKEPTDYNFKDLPLITTKQIQLIFKAYDEIALAYGATPISAGGTNTETHKPSLTLHDTRKLAKEALSCIPNDDLHYDEWVRIGLAIKAAFPEDEGEALQLWLDFSEKSHKFNAQTAEDKFSTFHPKTIGAATLYYLATKHGWTNHIPQSEPEDDFGPVPETAAIKKPSRLFAIKFNDITLDTNHTPLIRGVIDQGAMSVMYGESNTGKTFVALDMAFHIAAGLPWNNHRTTQGAVLYVAAEGGRGAKCRMLALRKVHATNDVPLFLVPCPVDLRRPDADTKPLIALAKTFNVNFALVVVDTLSRALSGGNENSSDDMGAYVMNADRIREATHAHVMTVHHAGKDTSKGARGHSLLRAATDTEIEIADNQLKITKQRDMEMLQSSNFTLTTHDLGTTAEGDPITSCTVSWDATIIGDFTEAQDIDYRQLDLLMGLQAAHAQIPAAESIQRKLWFETAFRSGIWPDNFDTAKRYMERAKNILIDKSYVSARGKNGFKLLRIPDKPCKEFDIFS